MADRPASGTAIGGAIVWAKYANQATSFVGYNAIVDVAHALTLVRDADLRGAVRRVRPVRVASATGRHATPTRTPRASSVASALDGSGCLPGRHARRPGQDRHQLRARRVGHRIGQRALRRRQLPRALQPRRRRHRAGRQVNSAPRAATRTSCSTRRPRSRRRPVAGLESALSLPPAHRRRPTRPVAATSVGSSPRTTHAPTSTTGRWSPAARDITMDATHRHAASSTSPSRARRHRADDQRRLRRRHDRPRDARVHRGPRDRRRGPRHRPGGREQEPVVNVAGAQAPRRHRRRGCRRRGHAHRDARRLPRVARDPRGPEPRSTSPTAPACAPSSVTRPQRDGRDRRPGASSDVSRPAGDLKLTATNGVAPNEVWTAAVAGRRLLCRGRRQRRPELARRLGQQRGRHGGR